MSSNGEHISIDFNPMEYFSWTNKSKKNFQYCEDSADYIDRLIPNDSLLDYEAKLFINYGIVNGRDLSTDPNLIKKYGEKRMKDYGVTAGNKDIKYVPAADIAIKFLHGQQVRRPFNPTFRDSSNISMNEYRSTYHKMIKDFWKVSMIDPLRMKAQFEWQQKYGVIDLMTLTPEKQQQMASDTEARVRELLPEDIAEHMQYKFKSSVEKDGQIFLDILCNKFDIEMLTDNNIVNLIASGKEIYYNGIRNNKVVFEPVNPIGFYALMNDESILIEKAKIIRRERHIPFIEVFSNHGNYIKGKEMYKKIVDLNFNSSGNEWNTLELLNDRGIYGGEVVDEANMKDGMKIKDTISKHTNYSARDLNFNKLITERHYVWVSLRKIKVVTRQMPDGSFRKFNVADNYVMNKAKKDKKIESIMGHELMQTYRLGIGGNSIHVSKGAVPFQYQDIDDPYSVSMPYSGVDYNLTMGNSEDVAPIDYGKSSMSKICLINHKLDRAELTDKGKILALSEDDIPEKYNGVEGLTESLTKFNTMVMKTDGMSIEAGERKRRLQDVMGVFDLSNNSDEVAKMNKLDYYENKLLYQIGADPRLLRMPDKYVAKDVRENTTIQSGYVSEGLFSIHNIAVERALINFVLNGISNIKEEEKLSTFVYGESGRKLREININNLKDAIPMIDLNSTSKDIELIDASKKLLMDFISYSKIEYFYALRVLWAKTRAEILEIAEESYNVSLQMIQQERAEQQKQIEAQIKANKENLQADRELKIKIKELDIERSIEYATIMSTQQERQFDIDRDGRNDLERIKEKDIAAKETIDLREYDEKMRALDIKEKEVNLKYKGLSKTINK